MTVPMIRNTQRTVKSAIPVSLTESWMYQLQPTEFIGFPIGIEAIKFIRVAKLSCLIGATVQPGFAGKPFRVRSHRRTTSRWRHFESPQPYGRLFDELMSLGLEIDGSSIRNCNLWRKQGQLLKHRLHSEYKGRDDFLDSAHPAGTTT